MEAGIFRVEQQSKTRSTFNRLIDRETYALQHRSSPKLHYTRSNPTSKAIVKCIGMDPTQRFNQQSIPITYCPKLGSFINQIAQHIEISNRTQDLEITKTHYTWLVWSNMSGRLRATRYTELTNIVAGQQELTKQTTSTTDRNQFFIDCHCYSLGLAYNTVPVAVSSRKMHFVCH